MRKVLLSLEDLLAQQDKIQIQTFLNSFLCSLESEVETFLHNNAIDFQEQNICRSYIIAGVEDNDHNEIHLLGYFSIALKGLSLDESVSVTRVKQLQGFGKTDRVIPVILIGQLGKNDRFRSEISGRYILEQIFKVVLRVQYYAGGRLALVECRNVQKLRRYYEANEFSLLQVQNGYLQMIRRI